MCEVWQVCGKACKKFSAFAYQGLREEFLLGGFHGKGKWSEYVFEE
jgi:hypothetical protein